MLSCLDTGGVIVQPLISIIVPVYKVEKYINRCVESLVRQTYSNLEIILVDDGSPDKCPQMCDEWAEKDKRIKVIHQKNGGLSNARNNGIDKATGEYIVFVDSDDSIDPIFCEVLLDKLLETGVDIIGCGAYRDFREPVYELGETHFTIIKRPELMPYMLNDNFSAAWGKVYKRKAIGDVRFPEGRIFEDTSTAYKFADNCDSIGFIDAGLYYYFKNTQSITTTSFDFYKRYDFYWGYKQRYDFAKDNYPECLDVCEGLLLKAALSALTAGYAQDVSKDDEQFIEIYRCVLEHSNPKSRKYMNSKYKLWAVTCGKLDCIHYFSAKLSMYSKVLKGILKKL